MRKLFILMLLSIVITHLTAQELPTKSQVLDKMKLANNYFMNKWPDPTAVIVTDKTRPSNLWTRGTYYEGLMQLYYLTQEATLIKYAVDWGTFHKWQPTYTGTTATRNADNQCCGQTYLELYQIDPKPERIATMQNSIDLMVNSTKVNDWWWIDAMQMAMPLFTKFGVIKNDNKYFEKMYDLYNYTKTKAKNVGLYNTTDHLWYRDSVYLPPKTSPNGLPVYWSRGNGWVIAALARTLDVMPTSAPHRDEYITVFKEMMAKIITLQRTDGFWNVNLGDANDYGGKETSGTSFFTFGLAWGLNKGYLDTATYLAPALKAWNGMVNNALHTNGALGYVQSTGSKPADGQPLSFDKMANFEDYGLGGFLLAGSEIYRLVDKLEIKTPTVTLSSGTNPATGFTSTVISPVVFTYANVTNANNVSALWYTDNTYTVITTNPSGLNLTINTSTKTVSLSGTPLVVGTYYYKVAINEASGNSIQASINVTPPAPTIVLTSGSAAQSLKAGLTITNIIYTLTNATDATITGLPNGLSGAYNEGVVTISGTIIAGLTPAVYTFTVTATALAGYTGTATKVTGTITILSLSTKILYLTAATTVDVKDTKLYPMLKSNSNYDVTVKKAATTAPASTTYSGYDLLILSESITSSNAELIALKTVDKPILSLKAFVYNSGSSRWNWGVANDGKANNGTVTVNQTTHPIFAGITLTNGTFNLLSGAATKGVQPVDLTNIGGITLAKAPKSASPYTPAVAIHDVPASVRGVANSKFLLVGICNDSYAKMTTDALTLFKNAIEYLTNGVQFQIPSSIKSSDMQSDLLKSEKAQNKGITIMSDKDQQIIIMDNELNYTGSIVSIFSSTGQLLQTKQLTGINQTFGKFRPGLFIVRINNVTTKVIIN